MIVQIDSSLVTFKKKFQNLCRVPYHGHPNGCPNYGNKKGCPPNPLLDEYFNLSSDLFVIYSVFNIGAFAEKMRQTHPEWSEHPRQWYNPRRWQGTARREHRKEIANFLEGNPDMIVNSFPEAFGVNVTSLMKNIGIELQWNWPPQHVLVKKKYLENLDYRVALGGRSLNPSIESLL